MGTHPEETTNGLCLTGATPSSQTIAVSSVLSVYVYELLSLGFYLVGMGRIVEENDYSWEEERK